MSRPFAAAIVLLFMCANLGYRSSAAAPNAPSHLTIAYQPGLGYAPLLIMKQERWIEKDFPATSVKWVQLSSGAAIRDGILSDTLQVGVVGTAPWLVGWAAGVDWKIIACASNMDLWLNVMDPKIKSLKDLKPGEQIALPAPDSIQAFALRKGAQQQLGNARALDTDLVALSHPLGLAALLNKQVTGHLSAPPFEFQEVERGAHTIFNSHEAMGETCFTAATMATSFYSRYPQLAAKFLEYMQRADSLIASDTARAALYVAEAEGHAEYAGKFKGWMTHVGVAYTVVPSGFMKYANFMKQIGVISKEPANVKELELPPLQPLGGN